MTRYLPIARPCSLTNALPKLHPLWLLWIRAWVGIAVHENEAEGRVSIRNTINSRNASNKVFGHSPSSYLHGLST